MASVFRTVEELIKLMKAADSKAFDWAFDAHNCNAVGDEEGAKESHSKAAEWTKKKEEIESEYLNLTVYSK